MSSEERPGLALRLARALLEVVDIADTFISRKIYGRGQPWFDPVFYTCEYVCHGLPWLVTSSLSSVFAYSYDWPDNVQYGLLVLNFGLLADLVVIAIVKLYVQRPRPEIDVDDQVYGSTITYYGNKGLLQYLSVRMVDQYSFPSGHVSRAALLATLGTRLASLPSYVALPFTVLVGATRLASGRHHLSDVLIGAFSGWATARLVCTTPVVVSTTMRKIFK